MLRRVPRLLLLASMACATAPPPPPPAPPPPPPPAPPPAEERLVWLAELQGDAAFERRGDALVSDPYRAIEHEGPRVLAWLAHQREQTRARLPASGARVAELAALDATPRARRVAVVSGGYAAEIATNGARSVRLSRAAAPDEPSLPLSGALAWSPSPDGALVALVLAPTAAIPSPHLLVYDWSGAVVDGPVADVVPTPPAWEGDDVFLYVLSGHGRLTVRRRFVGAGSEQDPVVLTELREGGVIRIDAVPNGPAWVEAHRGQERDLWLRNGPSLFRRVPEQPAGPAAVLVADHLVTADPAAGALRTARAARAHHASAWSTMPLPGVTAIARCGDALVAVVRRGVGDALVRVDVGARATSELASLGLGLVASIDGDERGAWLVWTDPLTPGALARLSPDGTVTWAEEPPALVVRRRELETRVGEATTTFELAEVHAALEDARPAQLVVVETLGAFGVSALPAFRAGLAAFLRRGGRWAFADVRGGGGHASAWHEAGRGAGESGAVGDLRLAVEALRAEGARVALYGAGHGGLTAAGLLAREPSLVEGAVLHAPVTDLVRFDRLPNAALWRAEYGDPSDPSARAWLVALSPYHRLRADAPWPPTLVEGALEGERVSWIHGAKLAARLIERERALLHVDFRLDDDARRSRWARALLFLERLATDASE